MGSNLKLALGLISTEKDRERAYFEGVDQVRYAAARERNAAESIRQIDPAGAALATSMSAAIDQREAQALKEIDSYYRVVARRDPPRNRTESAAERSLASLRPAIAAGPREFLTGRTRIDGVTGLHGLMAFEVLNFADGRRSGLDIYRAVAAEAREAGEHYFGKVTAEAVLKYLGNAVTAGMVRNQ